LGFDALGARWEVGNPTSGIGAIVEGFPVMARDFPLPAWVPILGDADPACTGWDVECPTVVRVK
jgi:hypothetical protein